MSLVQKLFICIGLRLAMQTKSQTTCCASATVYPQRDLFAQQLALASLQARHFVVATSYPPVALILTFGDCEVGLSGA